MNRSITFLSFQVMFSDKRNRAILFCLRNHNLNHDMTPYHTIPCQTDSFLEDRCFPRRFGTLLESRQGPLKAGQIGAAKCETVMTVLPLQANPRLEALLQGLWASDASSHSFWHSIWVPTMGSRVKLLKNNFSKMSM